MFVSSSHVNSSYNTQPVYPRKRTGALSTNIENLHSFFDNVYKASIVARRYAIIETFKDEDAQGASPFLVEMSSHTNIVSKNVPHNLSECKNQKPLIAQPAGTSEWYELFSNKILLTEGHQYEKAFDTLWSNDNQLLFVKPHPKVENSYSFISPERMSLTRQLQWEFFARTYPKLSEQLRDGQVSSEREGNIMALMASSITPVAYYLIKSTLDLFDTLGDPKIKGSLGIRNRPKHAPSSSLMDASSHVNAFNIGSLGKIDFNLKSTMQNAITRLRNVSKQNYLHDAETQDHISHFSYSPLLQIPSLWDGAIKSYKEKP
jgi:hypothetical protein